MGRRRIHLIAPAGSCRPFFEPIGVQTAGELMQIVQAAVGSRYRVTGDAALIEAGEDEHHGGRNDDRRRAADLEQALGDDAVVAVVSLRGGAWFTRVLPHVDFSVLRRRKRPVAVFGFSELTTLVNIVGSADQGLGFYDMGPAFLTYGLKRYASAQATGDSSTRSAPEAWMRARLRTEFDAFFHDVIAILEEGGTNRPITARLTTGTLPDRCEARFVGGNLTVLSMLIGSRFESCIKPSGRWLLLEDFNDKLERIDRFLAHLTLAGCWDACAGVLLGDFHKGYERLTPAVVELLRHHIPGSRPVPVLTTRDVGHVWPMSPLPLHASVTLERSGGACFAIRWSTPALDPP